MKAPVGRLDQRGGNICVARPRGPALVACVLVALTARAAIAREDFDPRSRAWNGLSYLVATAKEARVELELRDELDWNTVSPHTILLLVAPRIGPRHGSLAAFMAAGGRLIVADDFRSGYAWLRPFGIRMHHRAGPARACVGDLSYLPRFSLAALGPYLAFHDADADAAPVVVLNHPASLTLERSPPPGCKPRIRGYFAGRARGWLAEVRGAARVLALADSSTFINTMMRGFYGNKQLAANVMRYYCYAGEPCRLRLIANLEAIRGHFDAATHEPEDPPGRPDLRASLRRLANGLAELLSRREMVGLWWLLVLAAMGAPVVLTSRAPAPMLPPRTAPGRTRSRLEETVAAWLARRDADYRRPARQLAGLLARTVASALPSPPPSRRGPVAAPIPDELPAMVDRLVAAKQISGQAGRRLADLVEQLRHVTGAQPEAIDRARFTAMAAELEWAQQVLAHTARVEAGPGPARPPSRSPP